MDHTHPPFISKSNQQSIKRNLTKQINVDQSNNSEGPKLHLPYLLQ